MHNHIKKYKIVSMKKFFTVFSIFLLIACTNSKTPEHVISHENMVNIILDIHLTDGLMSINEVRRDFVKDTTNIYDEVVNFYGYTRKDFDTSLYYYTRNIAQYDKIYEEVLNRLSEMETILKKELNVETLQDSLL